MCSAASIHYFRQSCLWSCKINLKVDRLITKPCKSIVKSIQNLSTSRLISPSIIRNRESMYSYRESPVKQAMNILNPKPCDESLEKNIGCCKRTIGMRFATRLKTMVDFSIILDLQKYVENVALIKLPPPTLN